MSKTIAFNAEFGPGRKVFAVSSRKKLEIDRKKNISDIEKYYRAELKGFGMHSYREN